MQQVETALERLVNSPAFSHAAKKFAASNQAQSTADKVVAHLQALLVS
jgi:hypothetical protein